MYYKHLSIRVAWHDNGWKATVCKNPSQNSCCVMLPRIYSGKNDILEDSYAGRDFDDVPSDLLPCLAESAAFMNNTEWSRTFVHPYRDSSEKHKDLLPTELTIPPYSTFSVPFWWMLRSSQSKIEEMFPEPLPQDEEPPFHTSWVFGKARQEALLNLFFRNISSGNSMVFFYTKNGNAVDEKVSRLIVGAGVINKLNDIQWYDSKGSNTYPIWDRLITHSIKPIEEENAADGILLPYHEYLELAKEDKTVLEKLEEIKVVIDDETYKRQFSYGSELVNHDAAIFVLQKLFNAVNAIRRHGLVKGAWEKRLKWINDRMSIVWRSRGAFPGLGSVLEAMGIRYGTAMAYDMISDGIIKPDDNPWPVIDKLINREIKPPKIVYAGELEALRNVWPRLSKEKKELFELLSRFDISPKQAQRWVRPDNRGNQSQKISDEEILNNPYIIAELDETDGVEPSISVKTIDAGLMPDDTIAVKNPLPARSHIGSYNDMRRVRAIICSVLRSAADTNGDTLLSLNETIEKVQSFSTSKPCSVMPEWVDANLEFLNERVNVLDFEAGRALQLNIYTNIEGQLEKIIKSRAKRPVPGLDVDWEKLLIETIEENKGRKFDNRNKRFVDALHDQVNALKRITANKLSVLIGPAGTGKTSVLGALLRCNELTKDGVLLLAPTGKARVKLGRMAKSTAYTVAQFLSKQKRYNWVKRKPLFEGESKYRAEKTVVIDECSMLTIEDLYAVFQALDLVHVTRVILVGDPSQLPPIGAGRPFADICKYLDPSPEQEDEERKHASKVLAKLSVIVRQTDNQEDSDTLKLAAWFSGEEVEPNSDSIFDKLSTPELLNDLDVRLWKTPEELYHMLIEAMKTELGLASEDDIAGFNKALGFINDDGWKYPFNNPNGAESFQIISPVNNPPWGNFKINRFIQEKFRGAKLQNARRKRELCLGDQQIVVYDKVMQNINEEREGYRGNGLPNEKYTIANGEIGIVCNSASNKYLNVAFCGRPNLTFGYSKYEFQDGEGPLDLAYSISVHKSQGSDFKKVFLILPKTCPIISRELLYTALTRSKERLILLIEGENPSWMFDLSNAKYSETSRRNSHLFFPSMRLKSDSVPYAEHLIHTTEIEGLLVRSKSEVIIVNMLHREGAKFEYERKFVGDYKPGTRRPDFSFEAPGGDLIIWEHLGMLHRESYRQSWEEKKKFYEANGFTEGDNLFTTVDDERGTVDIKAVKETIEKIKALL